MYSRIFLAFVLGAAVFCVPSSAKADLIAHYKFDGDATDEIDALNDGFEEGDAVPTGEPGFDGEGEAFSFEGAGHVVVPLDLGPEETPDLTVTMWVKPDESIVDNPGLYKTFGHDDGGWDRTFGLDSRNGAYRYAAFTGGAGPEPTEDLGTPITNSWTFLAAVWDTEDEEDPLNSAATVTFYAGANSVTEPLRNTSSAHLDAAIGNLRPDNFAEGWQGLIDDVRIFDEALDLDAINEIRFFDLPDLPGDANGDRKVNLDDYELIQANAFAADPLGDPRMGDLNGDQVVDFTDFRIWKTNFPGGAAAAEAAISTSVPEPHGLFVLMLGLACTLATQRRRRA